MQAKEKARISNGISFAKSINTILALQDNKNLYAVLDTQSVNAVNGVSAHGYSDTYMGTKIRLNNANTDSLLWSNDTPTKIGYSFKSDTGLTSLANANNSAIFSVPQTDEISLSFWLKRETGNADLFIWFPYTNIQNFISFRYTNTNNINYDHAINNIIQSSTTIPNRISYNKWHHVLLSVKNGRLVYYIDGEKVYDLSSPSIVVPPMNGFQFQMRTHVDIAYFVPGSNIFYLYDLKIWGSFFDPANP